MSIELRTFGERVAWLLRRPEMDMSQKELAAGMGISEQFLSALIKGKSRPNVQHLRTMARLLHTSVDFLALETENAAPADADAAAKRARLLDVLKNGPAILQAADATAANIWLRSHLRVWLKDKAVLIVEWL